MFGIHFFWKRIWEAVLGGASDAPSQADEERWRREAQNQAPILWMLGKTGAGKSSIIHALTGADRAVIGNGFEPCTRTACIFDFPPEMPLIRFLDTRGLGEHGYDAKEDLAVCENHSHLIIVVARVNDPDQQLILETVKSVRARHPDWPVIVAQTNLHACYSMRANHAEPYAFTGRDSDCQDERLPADLRSCLAFQRERFSGLPGRGPLLFVPLDFTQPDDGYQPVHFGVEALRDAIEVALPNALNGIIDRQECERVGQITAQAHPLILGYAAAAMASGAIPVPFVDAAAIATVTGLLLRALAVRYETTWDSRTIKEFSACLGSGLLINQLASFSLREMGKMIPFWGQTAGLAMSGIAAFALTYAMGRAACVYLGYRRRGDAATKTDVQNAFKSALRQGFEEATRVGKKAANSKAP